MSNHHWCRDVPRDEAVRAAEDAAAADRPTLPDHRELPAAVEHLRSIVNGHLNDFAELLGVVGRINERVGRIESMTPKSDSASSAVEPENKGDSMRPPTTKTATVENDFADGPKCSPAVSETGEGQSGLRTERVTLEITYNENILSPTKRWAWESLLRLRSHDGESVRVVEEPERQLSHDRIFAASKKLIEVDQEAALRGFDTTTFQRLWISAIARVLGLELARPPRRKCVNLGDGSIPSPGILASPALVEAHQQIAALTDERDAAVRERDGLRAESERRLMICERMKQERDQARFHVAIVQARVAELEAAAKLAPAANTDGGSNHAPAASGAAVLAEIAAAFGCDPDDYADLVEAARLLVRERDAAVAKAASCAAGTEVVLPECPFTPESTHMMGWLEAIGKLKKAIAAAGVKVKEVGK